MTLLPPGTKTGDLVFVIFGASTPFVLRQGDQAEVYQLVGECYVHGFMDGEMFENQEEVVDLKIY
jgi:hypothetical protein